MDPPPPTFVKKLEHIRQRLERNVSRIARLKDLRTDRDEPYVYKPLPSTEHIRYLALEPGTGDESLRCSLRTYKIGKATYEAISYVWGSEIRDRRIYCDGYTINITQNLSDALHRLRDSTHTRELWADSICIDQKSVEEKSHQVAIMGHIYSRASRVIIYLGSDPDGHGPKVASLLSDVNEFLRNEVADLHSFEWNSFPERHSYADHPLLTDERWRSLRALLELRWFQRGWVVREAGLARQGLIVWGESEFPWQTLMWTASWIEGKLGSVPDIPMFYIYQRLGCHMDAFEDRYISSTRIFSTRDTWAPTTLLSYLGQGRLLQFKDRRDSIYAFLDLAVERTYGVHITPDYTKPSDMVFKNFAIQYLKATGDQTMLSFVIHDAESLESELPSWVPRWNALMSDHDDRFWAEFSLCSSFSDPSVDMEFLTGTVLKIRGIVSDKIIFVSETLSYSTLSPDHVRKLWNRIETEIRKPDTSTSDQFKDFTHALMGGAFQFTIRKDQQWQVEIYGRGLQQVGNATRRNDAEIEDFAYCHGIIARQINAKKFIVTKCGYFGLVPAAAQEGDIIARLFGSSSIPKEWVYLLRAAEKPMHYKLVGPAWIYYPAGDTLQDEDDYRDAQDIYLC